MMPSANTAKAKSPATAPTSAARVARAFLRRILLAVLLLLMPLMVLADDAAPPTPLLQDGKPVDWWFVLKFNARGFSVPLRAVTFWDAPKIPSTTSSTAVGCWDKSLGMPGAVEIALTGSWDGKPLELDSGGNHSKIGVSTDPSRPYFVFGDENQQGSLTGNCGSSQNGRDGMFFVPQDQTLASDVGKLIDGQSAPIAP